MKKEKSGEIGTICNFLTIELILVSKKAEFECQQRTFKVFFFF